MTGCLNFRSGRIKTEASNLDEGLPDKHTWDELRLEFLTRIWSFV